MALAAGTPAGATAALKGEKIAMAQGVPHPAVIAHRGASFYAPESTEAAYRLARNLGADYLECDLQRTKDGILMALHDNNLKRTTNIASVFPKRADDPVSKFTLAELKQLDAGTWFNKEKKENGTPNLARQSFAGAKICTLEEFINIAEGKLADGSPDPRDNGNRPGIYIETKVATQFPGIEKDLYAYLKLRNWLGSSVKKAPKGFDAAKNIGVQYTPARTILQTFEPSSLPLLNTYMPHTPKVFLIWLYTQDEADAWGAAKVDQGDPAADLSRTYGPLRKSEPAKQAEGESYAQFSAKWEVLSKANYKRWLDWARANGATGTGPGAKLAGFNDPVKGAQSYMDTVKPWMNEMTHDLGMLVHAYTIDEPVDMKMVMDNGVDGFFSNKCDLALSFFGRKPFGTVSGILDAMNY
ncbi:MAG: glycerophosphodiester phosphodiesterase [Desulfobacter sp.]|nr:MAG: glycerophosphodiester phosphodiesterase [Desulfobacter sp.]